METSACAKMAEAASQLDEFTRGRISKQSSSDSNDKIELMDMLIQIGPRETTNVEFNQILLMIQRNVVHQDAVTLMGRWKDCQTGKDISDYISAELGYTFEESLELIAALISNNFIKAISVAIVSKDLLTKHFQWIKYSNESVTEPKYFQIERDATRLDFEYSRYLENIESVRIDILIKIQTYLGIIENSLTETTHCAQETLRLSMHLNELPISSIQDLCTNFDVFLNTLDGHKEVARVIERDRCAAKSFSTHCHRNYKGSYLSVFGVPLSIYASESPSKLPLFLCTLIEYIQTNAEKTLIRDAWMSTDIHTPESYSLRALINTRNTFGESMMDKYGLVTVIQTVKIWMLELPDSVCSCEIYDELRVLYMSKKEDVSLFKTRVASVHSLVTNLPEAHYNTLAYLVAHWRL